MECVKNLISQLMELEELESRYGWQSCFDVPKAYDEMEKLSSSIHTEIERIAYGYINNYGSKSDDIGTDELRKYLSDIAFTINHNGETVEDYERIELRCQADYVEDYILEGYTEKEREIFESLFDWMDSKDRSHWLTCQEWFINNEYMHGNGRFFIERIK